MGSTFSMQASHKTGLPCIIFGCGSAVSSILGGILLLFGDAGLAGYFLLRGDRDRPMSGRDSGTGWDYPTALTTYVPHVSI